jgi:hypothetical protein
VLEYLRSLARMGETEAIRSSAGSVVAFSHDEEALVRHVGRAPGAMRWVAALEQRGSTVEIREFARRIREKLRGRLHRRGRAPGRGAECCGKNPAAKLLARRPRSTCDRVAR